MKLVVGAVYKSKNIEDSQKETQVPSKKLYKRYFTYESIEDIPDNINPNIVYHVGSFINIYGF